jgi:polysaccharide deacetylase family protein (PEP-CTERM system associated)
LKVESLTNTCKVLDLLARYQTRATFFVLGWVAERHPGLIKQIAECGHEIASHGYGHELVTAQTPELFRADVRKAKQILEDLTGSPVQGYRAPGFTITRETLWALPILAEEGLHLRLQHRPDPARPLRRARVRSLAPSETDLLPAPFGKSRPSTVNLGGVRLPIAGGSYFRLLPFPATLRAVATGSEQKGRPLVMYFHPWELDPLPAAHGRTAALAIPPLSQPRQNGVPDFYINEYVPIRPHRRTDRPFADHASRSDRSFPALPPAEIAHDVA